MATPSGGPPRWLERLLARLAPDTQAGRAALGDLHERWSAVRRRSGALLTGLWYLGEGLALVGYRWRGGPGGVARRVAGDIALSVRSLARRPVLLTATVLTLGPALAAAGAGLAVGWTTILRPLPHPEADRLVMVQHRWEPYERTGISTALYEFYRTRSRSLDALGLATRGQVNAVLPDGATRRVPVVYVTASTLELLGATPVAGRLLTEEEDREGAPPTVLLTHEIWIEAFGGDPGVVGRSVVLDGVTRTVVGVLEEGFEFPEGRPRLVLPTAMDTDVRSLLSMWWWYAVGRLASGSDAADAGRELDVLLERAVEEAPDGYTTTATLEANGIEPVVTPLLEWQIGQAREFVKALAVTVALLLGLAMASTATLLLGRAESRTQELRIRRALGAGRGRLFAHLLSDPVVLCAVSGALAAPVASGAVRALHGAAGLDLPRMEVTWLPGAAAGAAVALALALVPFFALIPLGRTGAASGAPSASRIAPWTGVRRLLLGTQVAVAAVLLTAALALTGSVRSLAEAPLGFRPEGVVTFSLSVTEAGYPEPAVARAFHRDVLAGVRELPGVASAGFGGGLPLPDAPWGGAVVEIEGDPVERDAAPTLDWAYVSEGYLETLGVPLSGGRRLEARDQEAGADVVVVNEAFAERYWGGSDEALGRRIRRSGAPDWSVIVGVVGNTADEGPGTRSGPVVFAPERGAPPWSARWNIFAVRSPVPPATLMPRVRAVVRSVDPAVPVFDVATMTERVRSATSRERLALRGVLFSGLASILVVAASLSGLVLLSLLRRRREIGVRKAVGATDGRLRWLLLRGAAVPAGAGLVVGCIAVVGGLRVPTSLLHGETSMAPVLAGAGGLIAALVTLTGALASLRVSKVEPTEALRCE